MKKLEIFDGYWRIISDSLALAWRHKHLWIFGFFATFAGFGGIAEICFQAYNKIAIDIPEISWTMSPMYLLPGMATVRAIVAFSPYPVITVVLFSALALLMTAIFVWIVITAVGGLIASVGKIMKGGDAHFSDGIKLGLPTFWRLFAVNALAKIVVGLAVLFTGTNLLALVSDRTFSSGLFFLASFIVFAAITVAVSVGAVYGSVQTVVEGVPLTKALRDGTRLLGRNWLVSLEMALLLLFTNLILGAAGVLLALVISVPVVFLFLVAAALNADALIIFLTVISATALLFAVVIYGSFMTTFQVSAWTMLWSELTGKGRGSVLEALGSRLSLAWRKK